MSPVRFHDSAEAELYAQAANYEAESRGLGQRFLNEIERALKIVAAYPKAGPPYRHGTRRVLPKVFRVSVVYMFVENEILVVAIAPFARKEGYWSGRVGDG